MQRAENEAHQCLGNIHNPWSSYTATEHEVPAVSQTRKKHIYATQSKQLTATVKKATIIFFLLQFIKVSKSISRNYGLILLN